MKRRPEDLFISDIRVNELEKELIMLRSDNMFLHAVIDQIEAACKSAKCVYNKDLIEVISIILSPLCEKEPLNAEEENEDAE